MVCERYLDLNRTVVGVSTYPFLDSDMGIREGSEDRLFSCVRN